MTDRPFTNDAPVTAPPSYERLTRLRIWATRHQPGHPEHGAHNYDGQCPWCRNDHLEAGAYDGAFDGNAHDCALELLDEITRLRHLNTDLAAAAGMDPKGGRELGRRPPTPVITRGPAGWGPGTPVQIAGGGPVIWRVAPLEHQEHNAANITVTSGTVTLRLRPTELTYCAPAPYAVGERVHRVNGTHRNDHGVITAIIPGPFDDSDPGIFVRWDDHDQGESGPYPPRYLERPADLALRWGAGRQVTLPDGRPGRTIQVVGASLAVAAEPYRDESDITWHHVTDLTLRP